MFSHEFNKLSIELTKKICKEEKKKNGIYFTPPSTIQMNLNYLKNYFLKANTVLEPSCGSGEYIKSINSLYPNINILGIENNTTIFDSIKNMASDKISLSHEDFLNFSGDNKFDIIIGNPPYFVIKKQCVSSDYTKYFEGRPNIFILFIIKALQFLNDEGVLSFVLPRNFLNCTYYTKTRQFISSNFRILSIIECNDNYIDTEQPTIILIIQKTKDTFNNESFVLNVDNHQIFGLENNISKLKELYKDSSSLKKLKFKVSVGSVVWNQCKNILCDDKNKTRLVYSSDINDNKLEFKNYRNVEKKNFIDKKGDKTPLLVVNRGYGIGTYKFNYCLIHGGFEYLVENHLICIKYDTKSDNVVDLYERVIRSLEDRRTKEFVKLYFGNSAINTKELSEIIPIYWD
jgi:type I restriction-modification system DNA methylase subunit